MPKAWTDYRVEQIIGTLLRVGVLASALVVLLGGALYIAQEGRTQPNFHTFHGEPENLRSVPAVVQGAGKLQSRAIIQLGLLLLILTPIARVVFSAFAFALERDRMYVVITLIVLAVLLYSLLGLR
jgi:uncharacterized membrane protein